MAGLRTTKKATLGTAKLSERTARMAFRGAENVAKMARMGRK